MVPMEVAPALLTAARGLLALLGAVGIAVLGVAPFLAMVEEFVVDEIPRWRLQWRQQDELSVLRQRLAVAKKRRLRTATKEAQRNFEEHQAEEATRQRALQRRKEAKERVSAKENAEKLEKKPLEQRAKPTQEKRESLKTEKQPAPVRRPSRPLQVLSPNVPNVRHPVSMFTKASVGVAKPKPVQDKTRCVDLGELSQEVDRVRRSPNDRPRHAPPTKSRVLSLGNIFDDANDENAAPVSSMWAH